MKKIYLILSVFAIVFAACETDFDVNAEWEETTVVFGLLDAAKDIQFIKIKKAFLGDADAELMASFSDSVNYIPTDLEVVLYKIDFNDTIDFVVLKDTLILKDLLDVNGEPGIFSIDNNIIYYFDSPFSDNFLSSKTNITYSLVIKNIKTGNIVSSTTEILNGFTFSEGITTSNRLTFYLDETGYLSKSFKWLYHPNVEIFQFNLRFHYKENGLEKELSWNQTALGSNDNILTLSGEDFFHQFLATKLAALDNDDDEREFMNIDIEMTLGTQDLKTYIAVNDPITGIVQERPQFTNINNGIGLFSSRYTKVYPSMSLSPDSEKYIIDKLGLNFK
tara:strand:- start:122 stop:1123 length:1002 start_codon:yes stop_codon:yes gene_type:complete